MRKFTKYPITASSYDDDFHTITDLQIVSEDPLLVEGELDGADYVNLYYDASEGKYIIEDPFNGVVASDEDGLNIVHNLSRIYNVDENLYDVINKIRDIVWEPPQWMQDLDRKFKEFESTFNPEDYHYACYYTAGNPTWGFNARKYVYEAGGAVVYGFLPRLDGLRKNRVFLYIFPSLNEYNLAKQAIKENGIIVDLQDPFKIDIANELTIQELEPPVSF